MTTTELASEPAPPAPDQPKRARWSMPWPQLIGCLVILLGVSIALYPQAASWFAQREQSRIIALMQEDMEKPPYDDPVVVNAELDTARAYNDALASGAIFEANTNVATGQGETANDIFDYDQIINTDGNGVMGRIRYDALTIDLPIYHGTSEETLKRGVGHLEGTSLPVGGVGTRSVLTAHRGLPEATLFNDLDKAKVGDVFSVSVLGEVLSYAVVEVQTVEPDQTEEILADPDRDLMTLVTCTPLGINSHRILVTGERIIPTPVGQVDAAAALPDIPGFPWWAVFELSTVVILSAVVWWAGHKKANSQ